MSEQLDNFKKDLEELLKHQKELEDLEKDIEFYEGCMRDNWGDLSAEEKKEAAETVLKEHGLEPDDYDLDWDEDE